MLLLSLIISLTLAFLYLSKKKMLSLRLYVLTKSENLIEKIIIFLIIFSVFSLLIYFISLKIKNFTDLNPVFAYVQNHYDHWKFTWTDVYKGVVRIESGSELLKIFNVENKFWNSDNNFYEMFNTIINNLFDKFKFSIFSEENCPFGIVTNVLLSVLILELFLKEKESNKFLTVNKASFVCLQ